MDPKPVTFTRVDAETYTGHDPQPFVIVGPSVDPVTPEIEMLVFDTTPTVPTYAGGQVYWDSLNGTLAIQTGIDSCTLQVGQEMYVRSRNNTGATILNGRAVRITGALGNRPTVALATDSHTPLGVATHDIPNNTDGLITVLGVVNELNTNAFTEGDALYLSATPGVLANTGTKRIGWVLRAHITQGMILVEKSP